MNLTRGARRSAASDRERADVQNRYGGTLDRPSPDRISRFAQTVGTLVPDATSASVILLLVVAGAALAFGTAPGAIVDAYYRGLWMLLPFTMQMTLILVLSSTLGALPCSSAGWSSRCRACRESTNQVLGSMILLPPPRFHISTGASASCWDPLLPSTSPREAEQKGIPSGLSLPALER